MLKKELEIEIIDLNKKKHILEAQVAEYENERRELVLSAHKNSTENNNLKRELDSVRCIMEHNGDIALRCYKAESNLLYHQIAIVMLISVLIFLIIL